MSPLQSFKGWNYRVVKAVYDDGEVEYGIHEMHYDPDGWTENAVAVCAETPEALRTVLFRMMLALELPIIEGAQ